MWILLPYNGTIHGKSGILTLTRVAELPVDRIQSVEINPHNEPKIDCKIKHSERAHSVKNHGSALYFG